MPKLFLFFFGPPGSGKGTQVDLLAAKLKLPVISPGELLRHEEEINSRLGEKVRPFIDRGKMVGDRIIEKMVIKRLAKNDAKRGAVFDGFPRTIKQHRYIIKKLKSMSGPQDKLYAVYIRVSDTEVKRRLGKRRVCDCGASYHLDYNPTKKKGICDLCGQAIRIRPDDKPEIIRQRLKLYHESSGPILKEWEKQGLLYRTDGERSIRAIHNDLARLYKTVIGGPAQK